MHASKEYRDWVTWVRKTYGKKNGCIPAFCWDCPSMEIKHDRSKKNYKRHKEKRIRD